MVQNIRQKSEDRFMDLRVLLVILWEGIQDNRRARKVNIITKERNFSVTFVASLIEASNSPKDTRGYQRVIIVFIVSILW